MSKYSLKIKLGDVELDFVSKTPSVIGAQLDDYLEMMLGYKPDFENLTQNSEQTLLPPTSEENEGFGEILNKVQNIDEELPLTLFMQRKASSSLLDDFIVTAFFLKNVLNQESFTIKSLNLNLYSAVNKIVDSAIIDKALECGYIKVVQTQDANEPTRYTIAPTGEGYYNKLQDV